MTADFVPHVRSTPSPIQVRFFRANDLDELEEILNTWLGERPDREIVHVRQSVIAGSRELGRDAPVLVVSVWYVED